MNVTFTNHLDQRYTFIHIPKSAGKSISAFILKHAKEYQTLHEQSHATLQEIKTKNKDLGHTFAIGRNPYSRAVSLYRYLYTANLKKLAKHSDQHLGANSNLDWHKDWIKQNGPRNFIKFTELLPWVPLGQLQSEYTDVDTLFKFEQIDKVNTFLQEILHTTDNLLHLNRTGDTTYKKYYDKSAIKAVYKIYKNDFKSLGYSKDINITV